MKLRTTVFSCLLLLATALSAQNTFTLTGTGGQSVGGYDIFPYYGNVNGGNTVTVMCDDFTTDVGIPSSWNASLTDLSLGDVSNTKFGNLRNYEEAFWLLNQAFGGSPDLAGLQLSEWSLMDGGSATLQSLIASNGYTTDVSNWLAVASTDAPTNLSYYVGDIIITPVPGGSGQEQLEELPEPSTLMLFGSGILGIAVLIRRKQFSA